MPWIAARRPVLRNPYLDWSLANGFAGHAAARLAGARVPVLLRLNDPGDIVGLVSAGLIDLPGMYQRGVEEHGGAWHCVGHARVGDLAQLESQVNALEFSWPIAAGAVDPVLSPEPVATRDLVIGIVDQGFAFLHQLLRKGLQGSERMHTRIAALWDQSRKAEGPYWKRPASVGYGRELDAAAIDALIARVEAGESEEAIYRELGYPLADGTPLPAGLHGTHVADTAAGLIEKIPPADSSKPNVVDAATIADLVLVSLPALQAGDTTGATPAAYWLDAVRYILERAGPRTPLVVNLSVGMLAGPHDGTSLISGAFDEILRNRSVRTAIVIAAGNAQPEDGERRWSARATLPPVGGRVKDQVALAWRLQPEDVTDSFVELWFRGPNGALANDVRIRVVPPGGEPASGWIGLGGDVELVDAQGRTAARLSLKVSSHLGAGTMALLALAPVAGSRAVAAPGRWRIEVCNMDGAQTIDLDAWIQRDEPPAGLDLVLQSQFDEVPGGQVPADSTISDLACGAEPLVVGAALVTSAGGSAILALERPYSSRRTGGAAVKGFRNLDFCAPADAGPTTDGLLAAGPRSGSLFRMSGTSVSAPIVTRQVANLLAGGKALTRAQIVAQITQKAGGAISVPSGVPFVKPR